MPIVVVLLLFCSSAFAESKPDIYFKSCRQSSLTVLLNIIKDANKKYKEMDEFSKGKCTRLKEIHDTTHTWDDVTDPKFEGCRWGVDAAIGMSPQDDELRKKFKTDLCL